MRPSDAGVAARLVDLHLPAEADAAVHEPIDPVVLRLPVNRHVATGKPVPRHEYVDVVVEHIVVAEIGEMARVVARGANEVVQPEARKQNAAVPAPADIVEDEGQNDL